MSLDNGDFNVAESVSKRKRAGKSTKELLYLLKVSLLPSRYGFTLISPQS